MSVFILIRLNTGGGRGKSRTGYIEKRARREHTCKERLHKSPYMLDAAGIAIKCFVFDIQRAQGHNSGLLCAGESSLRKNRPHQLRIAPVQAKVIIELD